jgi:hypothetical protein
MQFFRYALEPRFIALSGSMILTLLCGLSALALTPWAGFFSILTLFFGLLAVIGLFDLLQTRHAVLRNYPIMGHFRFFFGISASRNAAVFL